jgi:hypothetical protein
MRVLSVALRCIQPPDHAGGPIGSRHFKPLMVKTTSIDGWKLVITPPVIVTVSPLFRTLRAARGLKPPRAKHQEVISAAVAISIQK